MKIDYALEPKKDEGEYVDPVIVEFMQKLLSTWAYWAYGGEDGPRLAACSIFQLKRPAAKKQLDISDDNLLKVHEHITNELSHRRRTMIIVEFWERIPVSARARQFNCSNVEDYKEELASSMQKLYYDLMPDSEEWRLSIL